MTAGIEAHSVEGVRVQVYSVSKTIADCFKFRNKVGLDVAIEALREAWRMRRFTMDELWTHAKVCRVSNVMRPYLEMLPGSGNSLTSRRQCASAFKTLRRSETKTSVSF